MKRKGTDRRSKEKRETLSVSVSVSVSVVVEGGESRIGREDSGSAGSAVRASILAPCGR